MEEKLLPYQLDHVKSLYETLKNHKRALDASDTGTGKTYTTVALCKLLNLRPFIICPKSVISTWTKVLSHFDYDEGDYELMNYEQVANKNTDAYSIDKDESGNYRWNFNSLIHNDYEYLFIYDEAHKCKNKDTINAKILYSLSKRDVSIILLSATVVDKPLYFVIIGIVLKLYDTYDDGIMWLSNLCNRKSKHPLLPVHDIIFPEYASRMCVDDLQDIFKNNVIETEGIEMDNYYDIERQYMKINKLMENNNPTNLGTIQKIRMHIEFLKVDTFVKMTLNYLKENKSVVIFVNFTNTLKELARKLNTNCMVYGQQTVEERSKHINEFCSDESRVIICNIQSGGAGISLHDTRGIYPRVSLISPTWSAQDLLQVLGRIHRATGKTDSLQRIVFCKKTVEEGVGAVIKEKINNIRVFNDGEKKLKQDNMECILQEEQKKKKKQKEKEMFIYETNDFDKIEERIDKLYHVKKMFENKLRFLKQQNANEFQIKELEFKLEKLMHDIDFNKKQLNNCINKLMVA